MRVRTDKSLMLALALLGSQVGIAADNQSVSASKISVPSGPGSIEGFGESFEPQLNTGTYVFKIPFKLTKLRGAAQPEIALSYNSGGGDGILGMGWRLSTSFIQRQTDKGLPNYTAADTIVDSTGEELVKLADGTFRAENESGFVKWEDLGASGWKATLKDGTMLRFGQTTQARQNHPTLGTFKWLLESAQDLNGNRVTYSYITDSGQVYLSQIEWGLHASQASQTLKLALAYADGRPDPVVSYLGRFRCETRKRLTGLTLSQGTRRIRCWKLDYHTDSPLSLLKSVTVFGDDRSAMDGSAQVNRDFLPALQLDYARQKLGENWQMITVGPDLNVSFANREADLVDLNRDGLPDLIFSDSGNYDSALNRGSGQDFGAIQAFTTPAYLPALQTPGVRIADWRGDAHAKLLIPDNGQFYYRDFTSPTTVGADVDYTIPGSFALTDPTVQMIDVNNDRAMDLVAPAYNRFAFILSSPSAGAPQFQEGPPTPLANTVDFTQGWQFADMNGDRIPDLVAIGTTQDGVCVYHPHQGLTEFDAVVIMTGGPGDADLGSRGRAALTLVDIDMDGLADLVLVDSGVVKVWPNRAGLSWGTPVVIAAPSIPDWNDGGTAVRFADMNGNGSVDIVWNDPGAGYFLKYLELHPQTKPNQLIHMSNGMGKTLEIEYQSSVAFMLADEAAGHAWTTKPPFPMPVVAAFTEHDGMGGNYRTELAYRNGYYDAIEREFRGFETAIRTEVGNAAQGAPSLVTEYLFHTGYDIEALKGRPRQVERRETGGAVFNRVSSTWQTRHLPLVLAAGEARQVTYCFQQDETSDILEKGNGTAVRLFKEMEWDNYGNQTRLADYGRVEGANRSAWHDERIATRAFTSAYPSGIQNWILGLPVTETIADENGTAKARTEYFYDDESFGGGNAGAVMKGNLTLVRKAVDVASNTAVKAERLKYDAFGNVIQSHDPLAGAAPGHFRSFAYDPDYHTYVESEVIDLGNSGAVASLSATAAYDKGLGVMTSSTDFNGNVASYVFDTFARLSAIVKPGDTLVSPTELYDYKLGMDVGAGRSLNWISASKRETAGGGTVDARMFFDGLGRKVMTRSEGENPGQTVVTDTVVFNNRRGAWKQYLPYFDTGGLDWKDLSFQSAYVENTYDAAGRLLTATNPPETAGGSRKSTRTDYQPLKTALYDEEDNDTGSAHAGTPHVQYKDGLGRLVGVDEMKGAETWPTRYAYDLLDDLTRITDSQGNVKTMAYDGLKRLTGMDDPDRGVMAYTFDDASNLTETADAKAQHIVMTYDGANRIKTEDYLDARGLAPDVSYAYDVAAPVPAGDGSTVTATNPLGKLVKVSDLSGEEHLSHDARGRAAWKIKRVRDPVTGVLVSYQSAFAYDSLDRLIQLTYPDGDHIGYGYNSRSLPKSITGGPGGFIIQDIAYIATGQHASCQYGNGVTTSYQYDPRLRLHSLTTLSPSAVPLIDFSYTFDGSSNITRIDDKRAAIPASDPRKNTQVFAYDDLYRLTSVQYPALLSGSVGSISYAYDRIGNMLSQASNITATENGLPLTNLGTMNYGGTMGPMGRMGRDGNQPGPHALSTILNPQSAIRNYPYDANGNMTAIDGLTCIWDFKDRLIAVENATMRADYTYDYTDRRITKKVTPKALAPDFILHPLPFTLYPDRTYELREDGAPVKYVWNGETRVARVTTNLNASQRLQRFRLQAGWNICTLAVALTNAGTQLAAVPVQNAYRYNAATRTYHPIASNESLPAGTLLRIRASAGGELAVRGTPGAAASVNYPAGRQWIGNASFQPLTIATALPPDAPFWFFDPTTQAWRNRFIGELANASDVPAKLEPGAAILAIPTAPFTIAPADPTLEIRYYHQDHLGSSSVMTDVTGQLVSESAFYPFGHPRNEHEPRGVGDSYGFTQKERDGESGLNYFEARYLSVHTGRFLSVDPAVRNVDQARLGDPQQVTSYAYCANGVLKFVDMTGKELELANGVRLRYDGNANQGSGAFVVIDGGQELVNRVEVALYNFSVTSDTKYLEKTLDSKGRSNLFIDISVKSVFDPEHAQTMQKVLGNPVLPNYEVDLGFSASAKSVVHFGSLIEQAGKPDIQSNLEQINQYEFDARQTMQKLNILADSYMQQFQECKVQSTGLTLQGAGAPSILITP